MSELAATIHQIARGKRGAKHLTRQQARQALDTLLRPQADPVQLGAFLIALRMKGETPEELAGFVDAARSHIRAFGAVAAPSGAVDLPCYAGKRRASPLHLIAALQARENGIPVFIHAPASIPGRLAACEAAAGLGVRRASDLIEAARILAGEGIVCMDLDAVCGPLAALLRLRSRLGVRTFAHTSARLLNPLRCAGQINGFFHTPYGEVMARANMLLGQPRSLVFNGAEGEPELYADRQKMVLAQEGQRCWRVRIADARTTPYPRRPLAAPDQLLAELQRVQKEPTAREVAVLERMRQAFAYAAWGERPKSWCFELTAAPAVAENCSQQ